MSYTAPGIDGAGLHVPEYEDIKQRLLESFRQIFGNDLYLGADTQDYQMIAEFSDCLDDVYSLIIEAYNNRNPNYATGTALDMIIALNGLRRITATKSTVVLTLSGVEGTVVPAGSVCQDVAGYQWTTDAAATIPAGGSVNVNATCTVAGAVNAAAESITLIMSPTAGWVSVTNANAAVAGTDTETDAQLHDRREKSVANTGISISEAMYGAVRALAGVTKERMYQNSTGSVDANGVPAHSICMSVLGGDGDEIGKTIFNKKAPGVGTYGGANASAGETSVTVVDVFGNNNTILFNRPQAVTLTITVKIKTFSGYYSGVDDIIKQNIVDYISKLNIGDDVNVGLLYAPILAVNTDPNNPICSPTEVKANTQATTVAIAYNEYPTCAVSNITVTVDNG